MDVCVYVTMCVDVLAYTIHTIIIIIINLYIALHLSADQSTRLELISFTLVTLVSRLKACQAFIS